ncbi:MAG: ParB/RepB/Spo0J family partition protein, partial [Candidatus Pacebacteria bacterium]|nr:ParB/RepB/Spo0J family partition protein [Candidatus Paceibacterota bacterium]
MVKTQKQEDTQVVETLKCSDITPDLEDQPRTYFDQDKLNALGRSIKVAGQMMPIVVKPLTGNPEYIFQLVDGERRLQASIFVGMETIRAIIRPNANFKDSVIMNLCREGHTPLEMAYVFKRLIDEFGHSVQEVADMTGRSITSVYQHLKILTLDPEVQALMDPAKHG